MEDLDIIKEFLIESNENLSRLDREIVELEKDPANRELVASIFRTIHTIKGTCGFLGFDKLTGITHSGENILSQVREGKRPVTGPLISIILQAVDATKEILDVIERTGGEGDNAFLELKERLEAFADANEHTEVNHLGTKSLTPLPEASPRTPARNNAVLDSTIRVDVSLLDKLMNLVGELVLARNQVLQFSVRLETGTFNATSQRLNLITSELQESVMKTRMQPIGIVWSKLPRVVRDLAAECGKYIQLNMEGVETELDRTIIEAIKDPLTHIVRNACDHGIERPEERVKSGKKATGTLSLRAFHEGGRVNIEISDDGGGISPEKMKAKALQQGLVSAEQAARLTEREALNLIFLPGFSTAVKVSSISGRGVGMDVVKTNIERIGGVVDLISKEGRGTTLKIKIPLTLAIIPGLVVTSSQERFIIPQVSLIELIRLEGESGLKQIERIQGIPVYRRRGKLLPLTFLDEILQMPRRAAASDVMNIVVLQAEDSEFGLVVEAINDTQEIVVKALDKRLKSLNVYSGATIMGDGKVALILDVLGIAERSGVLGEPRETRAANKGAAQEQTGPERQTLLLFSAGRFERLAAPLSMVSRLEEFPLSAIEQAGGRMAVQYRNQILPLLSLAAQLDPGAESKPPPNQKIEVVVFGDGDRLIGLVVDRILDIVEAHVTIRKPSQAFGLMGSAVVGRKVTDFIDLHEIIANSREDWAVRPGGRPGGPTVLVVEHSSFARAHLRSSLEMAGYRVLEAAAFEQAVDRLLQEKVGIVAASVDFAELARYVKREPTLAHIPVLGLLADAGQSAQYLVEGVFEDFQMMFDRKAMLSSLERLASALERSQDACADALR